MANKVREKKKQHKSKSKEASESEAHDLTLPASTAPLPNTKGINSNPPTPSRPFSSPLSNHVPRALQSSPSYVAQQSLKRKRDAEGAKQAPSFTSNPVKNLDEVYKNMNTHGKFEEGIKNVQEKQDAKDEDSSSSSSSSSGEGEEVLKSEDDKDENAATTIEDFVTGVEEAARAEDRDVEGEGQDSEASSSSGSSSTSSASSSSSSSSGDSETENIQKTANDQADSDSETEAESEESGSPSKRFNGQQSNKPETSVAGRNPPPPELAAQFQNSAETSVATRNPPPPELEGQFKFTNSISGQNIYRYPKVVLDTLTELESIIPNTVITLIEETPSAARDKFMRKHGDGNEDTKRMLLVLEGAKHTMAHLGKVRLGGDGKLSEEDQKEELMKKELMRIARDRGQEVEVLRGQVKGLREEIEGLKEKGKRKKKGSS